MPTFVNRFRENGSADLGRFRDRKLPDVEAADVSTNRDEGSNFAANHWGNSQQSDIRWNNNAFAQKLSP